MTAITSQDMIEALRRHYLPEGRPAGGLFADEIASPDGARRADLIWLPTNLAGIREACLVGHEVKVSRADVMTELKDPTKADPWAQYCDRWWLVIPEVSLIEGLSIPEMWGIMTLPSGRRTRSMTVVRQAPKLKPTSDLGPALTRIAGYVVNRLEIDTRRMQHQLDNSARELSYAQERLKNLAESSETYHDPKAKRIKHIIEEFEKRTRDSDSMGWYTRDVELDEMIINVLIDYKASIRAAKDARHQATSLLRTFEGEVAQPMERIREALKTALDNAMPEENAED